VKIRECEEIRAQVVTPQRMELLRVKLREEVEGPYKEVQINVHVHP